MNSFLLNLWAILFAIVLLFGQIHMFGRVFTGPFYVEPAQKAAPLPTLRRV